MSLSDDRGQRTRPHVHCARGPVLLCWSSPPPLEKTGSLAGKSIAHIESDYKTGANNFFRKVGWDAI